MHIRLITFTLGCLLLTGCGAFLPVVKLDQLSPEKRNAALSVKIFNASQLIGMNFDVLNVVEGNSCQNKLYDPPATRAAAIDQAKYFASEMGADGITNIQCGDREGTSTRTNCWELVSCTAEAIKIAR
jgi:hypothetical protein